MLEVLWYNVFATDDARVELGGQPFDNRLTWYFGSTNDFLLNYLVKRYKADAAALTEMQKKYQTTGKLPVPLVTMHTTADPIVPYWQEALYGAKVLASGSLLKYVHLPVVRYGHCAFQPSEVVFGFGVLVAKVNGL